MFERIHHGGTEDTEWGKEGFYFFNAETRRRREGREENFTTEGTEGTERGRRRGRVEEEAGANESSMPHLGTFKASVVLSHQFHIF